MYVALDFEGELDARWNPDAKIYCFALYDEEGTAQWFTWDDSQGQQVLRNLDNDPTVEWIVHTATMEVAIMRLRGFKMAKYHDIALMSYCLDPRENTRHSLDSQASKRLGKRKVDVTDEVHLGKVTKKNWWNLFHTAVAECPELVYKLKKYNIVDAQLTLELFFKLYDELFDDEDAFEFYKDIELPYADRIIEMLHTGAYIDRAAFAVEQERVKTLLNEQERAVRKLVPRVPDKKGPMGQGLAKYNIKPFNPNSPHDRVWALERTIPTWKPTKIGDNGLPSTDKYVLQELADQGYELPKALMAYSKTETYLSTFVDPIIHHVDKFGTNVIRANFNQTQVRTGRLSSSGPNLQNIPARDERGAAIRSMFTAPEGKLVLVGDLDRIELVELGFLLESMLGYDKLSQRIKDKEDVHMSNTLEWSIAAGLPTDETSLKEFRKMCKNGIFCLVYGGGKGKFAQTIQVPQKVASAIMENSELIQVIYELRDAIVDIAESQGGIIHNYFGRRLTVPELMSKDKAKYSGGVRKVFNYMIQSTAGDAFKYLQNKAAALIEEQGHRDIISQSIVVHDEAMYYCSEPFAEAMAEKLSYWFTTDDLLVDGDVNAIIRCQFHTGKTWWEAKKKGE